MMMLTAHGRLAHQPELNLLPSGTAVCEFRLLSTRYGKGGVEHTEAATFICYGEMAENFCSTTEKGQEIFATGTQVTKEYEGAGGKKTYVKYQVTWFDRGRKPYRGERAASGSDGSRSGPPPRPQASNPPRANRPSMQPPNGGFDGGESDFEGGDFQSGSAPQQFI